MRIFIGLAEVANNAFTYAKAFQALGHETYTVIVERNSFYLDSTYDTVLNEVGVAPEKLLSRSEMLRRRIKVFIRALRNCDTFLFLFGTSFLPGHWDYPILKLFGKHIVSIFFGDDVRYWYAYEQEMRLLGWEADLKPYLEYRKSDVTDFFVTKLKRVRAAERYADLILSQPSQGELQTRPYMRVNVPLNLSQYHFNVPEREVPLVVHAPSDRAVKGTEFVLETVEKLKREGLPFEFQLAEKMPNTRVRELLAKADIVVDQLFSQTVAGLALESLATGNVVLAKYSSEYSHIPSDCPVVNVTVDTLPTELRRFILNRDLRRQLANAGRKYVERHHNHIKVARQILGWLKPGGIREYDFVPTFFQKTFVMPSGLLKEERKRMRRQRMERLSNLLLRFIRKA